MWKPIQKRAHAQLVREHLATVISVHLAIVDLSWHEEWNQCAQANLRLKQTNKQTKNRRWGMNGQTVSQNSRKRGKAHHHHQSINIVV